ncbi:hypothetical protein CYMTET_18023 [Cymbomonas tetramitiformis]|uniref:Uncharacterized protein n=1 Tax=Cymbomonas tetramitiformis TaxID=36881 RepID=A0AAE0L6P9_9CHLO|nr:hypothetical protein CYMTET_18023 [Cymbomonas tetramitiformis]
MSMSMSMSLMDILECAETGFSLDDYNDDSGGYGPPWPIYRLTGLEIKMYHNFQNFRMSRIFDFTVELDIWMEITSKGTWRYVDKKLWYLHEGYDTLEASENFVVREGGGVLIRFVPYGTMGYATFNSLISALTSSVVILGLATAGLASGFKVKVYWPQDDAWYTGTVGDTGSDGLTHIAYEDGDKEDLDMSKERRRLTIPAAGVAGLVQLLQHWQQDDKYEDDDERATLEDIIERYETDGMVGDSEMLLSDDKSLKDEVEQLRRDVKSLRDAFKVEHQTVEKRLESTVEEVKNATDVILKKDGIIKEGEASAEGTSSGHVLVDGMEDGPYLLSLSCPDGSVAYLQEEEKRFLGRGDYGITTMLVAAKQVELHPFPDRGYVLAKRALNAKNEVAWFDAKEQAWLPLKHSGSKMLGGDLLALLAPDDPSIAPEAHFIFRLSAAPLAGREEEDGALPAMFQGISNPFSGWLY